MLKVHIGVLIGVHTIFSSIMCEVLISLIIAIDARENPELETRDKAGHEEKSRCSSLRQSHTDRQSIEFGHTVFMNENELNIKEAIKLVRAQVRFVQQNCTVGWSAHRYFAHKLQGWYPCIPCLSELV
jgi:hypothetical protein